MSTLNFKNGVLPIASGEFTTTGFMGCDYFPYDPSVPPNAEQAELLTVLSKIYPDASVREYCMYLFASCLDTNINLEQMYFHYGNGGNGKSIIFQLLEDTFGDYCCYSTKELLDNRSEEFISALKEAYTAGRRIVIIPEVEDVVINSGTFKQLLGSDIISIRFGRVSENRIDAKTAPKLFYVCNAVPRFSVMDGGIRRRVCVIPYESNFTTDVSRVDESKHIYRAVTTLSRRVASWAPYFAGMLVWYYRQPGFQEFIKGRGIPPKVKDATATAIATLTEPSP
jgi:putative DNA primase/helicase